MKNLLLIASVFSLPVFASAQEVTGFVEDGVALVHHVVGKGESLYSLSKLTGAEVSTLLKINNLPNADALREGQEVKLPLAKLLKPSCPANNCIKVYHEVQPKEGLYRIGVNYGNQKMAALKALNQLPADAVSIGQRLLVGYLPADAKWAADGAAATAVAQSPAVLPSPSVPAPVAKEKKESGTRFVEASTNAGDTVTKTEVPAPVKKEELKPVIDTAVAAQSNIPVAVVSEQLTYSGNGFFENAYKNGSNESAGLSGVFKSASGWNDGKFYVLMSGIEAGTVVKLSLVADTGKFIFAKVLGELPAVKKDKGMVLLRMNSAAAAALGVSASDSFQAKVQW